MWGQDFPKQISQRVQVVDQQKAIWFENDFCMICKWTTFVAAGLFFASTG